MIYLVTNTTKISNSTYEVISIKESLELLNPLKIVGVDTETEGFDVYKDKLLLVQFGCYDFQIVIDCKTVDITIYKPFLESKDKLFLFWNAKFDLKFFYHQGIVITNVYDGYLAEKLMWLGYPPGIHELSLRAAGITYLDIELDKTVRGKIFYAGLADDVIKYSANDVKYLEQIRKKQLEEAAKKELIRAINFENKFVIVLAYIEYCGVKLDIDRWKRKMESDKKNLFEKENLLNNWVVKNFPGNQKYTYINKQGDLFLGFDTTPKCIINWNSAQQVIPLFEELGFNLNTFDKATGKTKKSIDAKIIEPQKTISPIAPIYLEYRAAQKIVSTYGENLLKQVNIDGRIHTQFNQLMDTGRLSCGGKNKNTKEEYINLQNLPADEETRACFIAENGNKWVSIDYSGQETFLIASIANDQAIIKELTEGSGDIHSLTAKMAYPDIIGDCPVSEIKDKFKHYRQEAKGIEFAINYGGDANTIAKNKGIPLKEAQIIYDSYMNGFKGVKAYQDYCRKDVMQKGYILLNPITGHKSYIYDFYNLRKTQEKFNNPEFWQYYREMKAVAPECETVQEVRRYFKRKSASEKQSINYRIQGTGALCFKLASIYFFNYLLKENLLFKVKYCIPVHDEINVEAPEKIAEDIAKKLKICMVKAGEIFCTKCHLDADISRLEDGTLPTYWIH